VGSAPLSIQCDPPGRVRWLCPSTMPGMIVVPPVSTTSEPAATSPSSSAGLIHAILPSLTAMLTPVRSRGEPPSASAASR
jgi:hypothetical protein